MSPTPIRGHAETSMHWLWIRTRSAMQPKSTNANNSSPRRSLESDTSDNSRSHLMSNNNKQLDLEAQAPRYSLAGAEEDVVTLLASEDGEEAREKFDESAEEEESAAPATSSGVSARVISDAIIGLSDGLTVPFALTAGLSALGNTRVVIFAGMAELTAGAISMGLGGYLGAKSEEQSYQATLSKTLKSTALAPSSTTSAISSIFEPYALPAPLLASLTTHLQQSPALPTFLMTFQHQLPAPEASRAVTCALTIAGGYFLGGFLPLLPYFCVQADQVLLALWWSLGVMGVSLFVFGYGKTCFVTGWKGSENVREGLKGGAQMVVVGAIAAGAAMGFVRLFDSFQS